MQARISNCLWRKLGQSSNTVVVPLLCITTSSQMNRRGIQNGIAGSGCRSKGALHAVGCPHHTELS